MKVAAYCRVSTESDEQLDSIETQKLHYEAFIRLHSDWECAGIYYDNGITGTKADIRDDFQNMISDCRAGLINRILVKSVSRFSRNTTDCLTIVRELNSLGISVYFEKENLDTAEMESELILSILSSMAAEESTSISQNVKWSIKKKLEDGTFKMSYAPYGYKLAKDGGLVIDEAEAEIVNMIFEKVIDGNGSYVIARELNERGIPARKCKLWSETTILNIIENEKYIGDALFQKTFTDSNFKRHRNKGDKDCYLVTDHHDPIIPKEIFDKANAMIKFRARNHHADTEVYQNRYCFSGKLECGVCGGILRRVTHANKHICWSCKTHIRSKEKCSLKAVRDDSIKAAFVTMLNKLIFSRKILLKAYYDELRASEKCETAGRTLNLRDQQKENLLKMDSLRKLRAHNIIDSISFNREMSILENNSYDIRTELSRLGNVQTADAVILRETEKLLKFTEHSLMQDDFDEEIYSEFVENATVPERQSIVFHLKCGLNLKEVLQCMDTK